MTQQVDHFANMWEVGRIADVEPFQLERRCDLVAGGLRATSDDTIVIFEENTPDGQVRIVKNIAPFLLRRINMNTAQETVEYVLPSEADGFFSFNPLVGDRSAAQVNADYNAPSDAANAQNTTRAVGGGSTFLSRDPKVDAQRYNPLYNFPVESNVKLSVNFNVLPLDPTNPLPNAPVIGDTAGLILNRVDFAGVCIFGVQMPVATYQLLLQRSRIS